MRLREREIVENKDQWRGREMTKVVRRREDGVGDGPDGRERR